MNAAQGDYTLTEYIALLKGERNQESLFTYHLLRPTSSRAFFSLLKRGGEKEVLHESPQTFEVTAAQFLGQASLCSIINLVFRVRAFTY